MSVTQWAKDNWYWLVLAGGLGTVGCFVVKRKQRTVTGLSGDYTDIVADKAQEAIRDFRSMSYDYRMTADAIERAWRDWDFEALVDLQVIGHRTAAKASAELAKEIGI